MLRGLAFVLLASPVFGLGVDDTEKRRSEEILRAVAAAATADYEGLQQMKLQKSRTFTTITAAEKTKECVGNLITAMEDEKRSLAGKAAQAIADANETDLVMDAEKTALRDAIQKAIQDVYKEIQRRYTELQSHSAGMMDALQAEVLERTSQINNESTPEKLFQAIINHAAVQLNAKTYTHPGEDGDPTGLDPTTVQQHLAEMMLHDAIKSVHDKDPSLKADSEDYVNMLNILLFAGASTVDIDPTVPYPAGAMVGDATVTRNNTASPLVKMFQMNMTLLERKNLQDLEKEFVDWTVAKSKFHNVSTKKSAVDAAIGMLGAKLKAIAAAKEHIKVYDVELQSLEDDEMRRIADIKEEFESLAADWLQLATYHCCDIVQGNTVECKDATDHLMQPINNVFPGALKAPDPARDCVRRLL